MLCSRYLQSENALTSTKNFLFLSPEANPEGSILANFTAWYASISLLSYLSYMDFNYVHSIELHELLLFFLFYSSDASNIEVSTLYDI